MVRHDGVTDCRGHKANVTGWLSQLIPYLGGKVSPAVDIPYGPKAQPYVAPEKRKAGRVSKGQAPCIELSNFPRSTTSTPFLWVTPLQECNMEMVAGIIGITVSETWALKPEVGWIVVHAPKDVEYVWH